MFKEFYKNEPTKCLTEMYRLHDKLASSSSSKKKTEILKEFRDSQEYSDRMEYYDTLLNFIYDKDITFGVTSKKADGFSKDIEVIGYTDPITILNDLSTRFVTGDTALGSVKYFIDSLEEYAGKEAAEMFKMILDKDFKCGVNVKTIGKVFPVKRPFTDYVALANKYFDREDKVDFKKEIWFMSRKLDGNRLILIKRGNDVKCMSRQGKEIKTLDMLKNTISGVMGDFVLDGEVCIIDNNGNENFQEIMKVITKKDYTIPHPVMKVFDILSEDEFYGMKESEPFSKRFATLCDFFTRNGGKIGKFFNIVDQKKVTSKKKLMEEFEEARNKGWEGLMIRKDVPYECGRTNNLLKVKGFNDAEYEVTGYEMGDMRFVEDGKQVVKEVLANITIKHKGYEVKVGSGFSKEEREYLHDHPEEIVGSIVKVQYFEETKNLQGGVSLRFPTVVYFYGKDGRFD